MRNTILRRISRAASLAGAAEFSHGRKARVTRRMRVFVVALAATLSVAFAATAAASTSTPTESSVNVDEIVARAAAADDFDALMEGLTPEEREVAIWALTPARSRDRALTEFGPQANRITTELGLLANWTGSIARTWESNPGVDLFTIGMTVGWRVSPNPDGWLDDRYFQIHTFLWRWDGWERWAERVYPAYISMVSQGHFIFGTYGVDLQNYYPCVRILGHDGWQVNGTQCST